MTGNKLFFESPNKELFDMLDQNHNWDLCLTVNQYGYSMMTRALELSESCKMIETTLFPNCSANKTNLCPDLKFSNKAIGENLAQTDAVKAIVTKRSGLAPVCFSLFIYIYSFCLIYSLFCLDHPGLGKQLPLLRPLNKC